MSFNKITYERKEELVYIGFGKYETKSLTTLCVQTLEELDQALDKIRNEEKDLKGLIFFSHKPDVFLAGVDVNIIGSLTSEAEAMEGAASGQKIFNKIEDLKIPSVALVDGFCLGGGLELSLACSRIIVSDSSKTKLGLPEVMLGVLPGFGGTYRLPRKVGLPNALDMILTGKQVRAKKAYKMGLADFMMPRERLLELAPTYLFKSKKKDESFSGMAVNFAGETFIGKKLIFQKARDSVLEKSKGFYPAPLKIIDVLERYYGRRREDYLLQEAKAFGELSQTTQSKNLVHIFFLQDNAKKFDKDKVDLNVTEGAVLGAGTMGGGIAWYFASNDITCYMKDLNENALVLGLKQASNNFQSALKRKRMTRDDFERKMRHIIPTTSYRGFKGVDLVIEAIVENMDIKKSVFKEVEKQVGPKTILTSNTSSLSVNEMASVLEMPERFAGLHFFNPVNKMPLVEIIRHDKVDQKTIDNLYAFVVNTKKTPIVVKDGPGFLVNRILAPYLNEASYLLEQGVAIEDIDQAALDFGMPMGPCHLMDEVGLDVSHKVGKILYEGLGERMKPSGLSEKILDLELLGKKNQKGFYVYDSRGKKGEINSKIYSILPNAKMKMDTQTLQMRLIVPMINEAAYCLEAGIVDSPEVLDIAMIFGIGFPPFRGGLLKYADDHGVDRIIGHIEKFASEVDANRYKMAPFLKKMGEEKKRFYNK
ncbi:MAG: enoyl-CoA hydratase/isomerase family protein [Halobacteriovoraceae bacterium]|nr:enoyl-CoA hydratase/isomerase family protein [Halobacteriovoraceae bacterium]MCB9095727.1 enoyl-CoA hydratase/isomerase family protein [Halobacteriovoraceae bacterium]